MGFSLSSLDPTSSKNAYSDIGEVALSVSTLGQSDILLGEGALAQEKRHLEGKAEQEASAKRSKQQKEEELRQIQYDRSVDEQVEAEQLAQRTLVRNRQSQALAAMQAQAQVSNVASQRGFASSSALSGLLASTGTTSNRGQSDLVEESARLSGSLDNNLDFLQDTFTLGGDINALNQQIANLQQDAANRQAMISGVASGLGAMATGNPAGIAAGALQLYGASQQ